MFPGKHSEGTVGSTERARYEPQRVNASDSHPIILQISEIESSEKKIKREDWEQVLWVWLLLARHTILLFPGKPGTRDKDLKTSAMEANKLPSCFDKNSWFKNSFYSRAVWSSFGIPKVDRLKSHHHLEALRKIDWMKTPETPQISRYGLWESRTCEYTHSSNNVSLVRCS